MHRHWMSVLGAIWLVGSGGMAARGWGLELRSAQAGETRPAEDAPDWQVQPPAAPSLLAPVVPSRALGTQTAAWTDTAPADTAELSVTVITAEELRRRRVRTVAEALTGVPGVEVLSQGGPGQIATAFIRGAASERTLVLFNGVEINDPVSPARGADLAKLSVDEVERIEVRRGPQSSIYGSGAMGGVINIVTQKSAPSAWNGAARAEAGTFATRSGALAASGPAGPVTVRASLSGVRSDGFSAAKRTLTHPQPVPDLEADGYEQITLDANAIWRAPAWGKVRIENRLVLGTTDLDNFGGDPGDDPDHTLAYCQDFLRLGTEVEAWAPLYQPSLNFSAAGFERTTRNGAGDAVVASHYQGRRLALDLLNRWKKITLTLRYWQETGAYHDESYLPFNDPDFGERRLDGAAVALADQIRWEALVVDASIRWDVNDAYGSATTFRVAPAYRMGDTGMTLQAAYGTAFNAPSLFQLYSDFGNAGLAPERLSGWEAGLSQELPWQGRATVVYFRNEFSDQIAFVTDPATFRSAYQNRDRVLIRGWEISADARPLETVTMRAAYARLLAHDLTLTADEYAQPLPRRADYTFSAGISATLWDIEVGLGGRRVGPRADVDFDPVTFLPATVTLDPYTVVELSLGRRFTTGTEFYLKIDNVLDADYVEILGYSTSRFSALAGVRQAW